jgi:hypothetical protein
VRTTECAPAPPPAPPHTASLSGSAPAHVGLPWKAGRFSGQDGVLQPDRTLRCPNEIETGKDTHSQWRDRRMKAPCCSLWKPHSPLSPTISWLLMRRWSLRCLRQSLSTPGRSGMPAGFFPIRSRFQRTRSCSRTINAEKPMAACA